MILQHNTAQNGVDDIPICWTCKGGKVHTGLDRSHKARLTVVRPAVLPTMYCSMLTSLKAKGHWLHAATTLINCETLTDPLHT